MAYDPNISAARPFDDDAPAPRAWERCNECWCRLDYNQVLDGVLLCETCSLEDWAVCRGAVQHAGQALGDSVYSDFVAGEVRT